MNLTNVNRLLKHYRELKGDELEDLDWTYQHCASGVLTRWGEATSHGPLDVATCLDISLLDASLMVWGQHRNGQLAHVLTLDGEPCQTVIVKMLEFLAENGYVAWPDKSGKMVL